MEKCKRVVHQTLVEYYKTLVICKKLYKNGSRYTRHVSVISENPISTSFRRLMGHQRDPRDRGVTLGVVSLLSFFIR